MSKPLTPLMQQYMDIKEQYPGTIILFQVGDFYELFFDDAKTASGNRRTPIFQCRGCVGRFWCAQALVGKLLSRLDSLAINL